MVSKTKALLSETDDPKARILDAATKVFATAGFEGARVDEIAAKAGLNKALLYYHVGDKERIYTAVLTSTIDRAYTALQESTAKAETPSAKLECVLDTFAELGSSNPHFVPIMLREIASGGATLPDEMLMRMARLFRVVAEIFAEGTAEGVFRKTDPLLTHVSIVGLMMFLIASQPIRDRLAIVAGIESPHTLHDLAEHTKNLMLRGIEVGRAARGVASPKKKATGTAAATKSSRSRK